MELEDENFTVRIELLRKLLSNVHVNPLSQFDINLMRNKTNLQEINAKCPNGLVPLLLNLKFLVKATVVIKFLLEVKEYTDEKGLEIAIETLRLAGESNLSLTEDDLVEIFKECAIGEIPPVLMVNIIGDQKTDEELEELHTQDRKFRTGTMERPSPINPEALKNFKI